MTSNRSGMSDAWYKNENVPLVRPNWWALIVVPVPPLSVLISHGRGVAVAVGVTVGVGVHVGVAVGVAVGVSVAVLVAVGVGVVTGAGSTVMMTVASDCPDALPARYRKLKLPAKPGLGM